MCEGVVQVLLADAGVDWMRVGGWLEAGRLMRSVYREQVCYLSRLTQEHGVLAEGISHRSSPCRESRDAYGVFRVEKG